MNDSTILTKPEFADTFIREVRVNYHLTTEKRFKITGPSDAVDFFRAALPDNSREHFVALYLDGSHQVACYSLISTGTANCSLVHPREVFQRAVIAGCCAMIVAHNHPSGNLTPSKEDKTTTNRLKEAGELLSIALLDSLILTGSEAFSILNDHKI